MSDPPTDDDCLSSIPDLQRDTFTTELTRLKQQGCCLLVTGSVSERVRAAQSQHLFGTPVEPRQRVLVVTDTITAGTARYLPPTVSPDDSDVTVLDALSTLRTRTAVGYSHSSSLDQPLDDASLPDDLVALHSALRDAIDVANREVQLPPGKLRIGLSSLCDLIERHGITATKTFVRAVTSDTRSMQGMTHFHFPGTLDSVTLTALKPVVDIHLELRDSFSRPPEQRWHLLGADLTSNWMTIRA